MENVRLSPFDRVRSALTFQEVDRPPVMPEIFALAATMMGETPRNYVRSGKVLAECQIEAQKRVGYDVLFAAADLCVEPEALGCGVEYPEDNYPHVKEPVLRGHADLKKLSVPSVAGAGRMPEVLSAVRILKREAAGNIPVAAAVCGPMTLASRIMDIEKMLYMIVDEPARFRDILGFCAEVSTVWTRALAAEGADIILMVDPSSSPSVLPSKIFREFSEAPVRSIFGRLKTEFPDILTWYSVAGPLQNNHAIMSRTGADITTVDYVVPIETAMEYSGMTVINGNIRPLLFLDAGPQDLYREARRLFSATRTWERFILGSGCEVPLYSNPENLRALIRAATDEAGFFEGGNDRPAGSREITILPHRKRIFAPAGASLLDAINQSGIQITSYCTKNGSCGKCLVKINNGSPEPPGASEAAHLINRTGSPSERLACHVQVRDDMEIYIPYFSRMLPNSIGAPDEFINRFIDRELASYGISSPIRAEAVAPPLLGEDADPHSGGWRGGQFAGYLENPLAKRKRAAYAGRGQGAPVYAVVNDTTREILDFTDTDDIAGLAVDIGTTTITAYVHDLKKGSFICVGSIQNPQNRWGQDIVTRSANAAKDPAILPRMQKSLVEAINLLISSFHQGHSLEENRIYDIVIVGNPVIIHLLLGLNPEQLVQYPFVPSVSGWVSKNAADFRFPADLHVNPKCRVEILPDLGGFVGGDALAGVLAVSMHRKDDLSLLVDIGTNGEVLLGNKDGIFAASVAAGPAFEGPSLTHGHLVRKGIIHSMKMKGDGQFRFETIGGGMPLGLCGSSVIDIFAEFVRHKIIDRRGRFVNEEGNPNIKNGHYVVVPKQKTAIFKPITVSKKDIEEVQKAKSAVRSAIDLLVKEAGVRPERIKHVYVSGAFGVSINLKNAKAIGMVPDYPWAEFKLIKNAAGIGARICLLSSRARREALEIAAMTKQISLSGHPDFTAHFVENMLFPGNP